MSGGEPRGSTLTAAIVGAMVVGGLVGAAVGPSAAPLGDLGKLVIQLVKAVATPLLFLSIVNAVSETEVKARDGVRLLGFATINASLALGLGLLLSNLLQPGAQLTGVVTEGADVTAFADRRLDLVATLASYVPTSLVAPFAENAVLTIVLLALLAGFGLRTVRARQLAEGRTAHRAAEDLVATGLQLMEVVLGWVLKLVPLAVFGVVAKTVGEFGLAPLRGLAAYVGVGLLGLTLHALVTYQAAVWWVGLPLGRFWREARQPMVVALGTNSSLATLPVTLRALDRLGVSKASATLGACVGTNLNNDGILLYEGMAVLFVAQANGLHLTLGQQATAAATSLLAAMGVAGVPEAGFVSLALVLNTVGLPIELLPLLLTVDWVVARGRSVVNVLSDLVLSLLVDGRRVAPPDGSRP